jgi:hypothetical protein
MPVTLSETQRTALEAAAAEKGVRRWKRSRSVPLLLGELAQSGYAVGERTIRRALHRPGYRCFDPFEELAERALAWLDGMTDADRHRRRALHTSKFDWLPT